MLCPAILYIVHCRGGDLLEHFKHVQMLDITLCVNQFEASTFPFQAAPLEFKLLRKTLLKCPIQVQDLTVISFRRQNQQLLEIKHFCFRWETWHLQFKFSTPARQGSTSPPLGHGQWAKAYGLLGGGMLKLWIDRCIIWCFLLIWLSLRNTTLSLSFGTYTRLMLKISRILQKLHQDHFQDERKLNIEIKCK